MAELFSFGFVRNALIGALLVSTVCSVIGVLVVLRGLAFAGAGIAHAAFGGVALGFFLGVDPLLSAVVFCLVTAGLVSFTSARTALRQDTTIGIFFSWAMALGVLFIGLMRRYDARVYGYLFGNVLGITSQNLVLMIVLTVIVLLLIGIFFKEFQFLVFDEEMAQASGLPVGILNLLLFGLIALTVVIALKAAGIILVEALLVIPAATAYQLTTSYKMMFVLSWVGATVASSTGLVLSYFFNLPSGATIVMVAVFLFVLAAVFSPKRKRCRVCGREV
ncbi:MAG: metal ABC transporter permease [candidate division WOR-3 bacterium]|uniref:Metal ABC transporter permease n=1 Tax=candidate division WOR-3 bacterium TaxID=2052148 RepID=A0A7C1SKM5_UNCW3|nr:metal ABC transporter permease [candidate division WOR-3 bacterium]